MSLKLLNPGLRPLGTFDLEDANTGANALEGGEYVELTAAAGPGAEGYAADVGAVGPMDPGGAGGLLDPQPLNFAPTSRTAGALGGLADEGVAEYGTLFGSLIGQSAGRSTAFGVVNGAVVIGPESSAGSGKVTVWAQSGLYGVNGTPGSGFDANLLAVANAAVQADGNGDLQVSGAGVGGELGIYVGRVVDPSLVSTTNAAAGVAATNEYHAIWYAGNAATTVLSVT
jgi:hypothetical protein